MLKNKDYDCLWKITRTTSKNAMAKIDSNRLDDETYMAVEKKQGDFTADPKPVYIYIDFWKDRSCLQKMMRIVYKVFRSFYVSFWFYFLPFLPIFAAYLIPKYNQMTNQITPIEAACNSAG